MTDPMKDEQPLRLLERNRPAVTGRPAETGNSRSETLDAPPVSVASGASGEGGVSGHPRTRGDALGDAVDYEQLRERLRRAVRRSCPGWIADDADDLVQVAMLRLLDRVRDRENHDDEHVAAFNSSYLYKVAYSAVVDEIRRRRARREVAIEDHDEMPRAIETRTPDPQRRTEARQLRAAIADCLSRLIVPRRRAVTLHLHGHSTGETAALLGRELKQARNLIYRGLADLRQCLKKRGIRP
jgi:RNA polymerase sigma-70 factor (ECF subfamily)